MKNMITEREISKLLDEGKVVVIEECEGGVKVEIEGGK